MPYCANCGTEVATDAAACPSCGHPQGAPAYARGPARRNDGQAITALILGIAGLVICPIVPSIFAIIIGNQSKARIAADPTLDGEQLANTGVILGWIGIVLGGIGLVVAIAAFFVLVVAGGGTDVNFGR